MRHAAVLLLLTATAVRADRMPDYPPETRAAIAEVCVIGTVTEIEKEPAQAKAYPGATEPTSFTVAVVKVETNVQGAKNVTHVRVGFITPAPGVLQRYPQPALKADQKVCLFLNKATDSTIYLMPGLSPPIDVNDANKATIESVRKMAAAFNDPMTALKAEKVADRALAASALVLKYRQTRFGVQTTSEAIPAEESKAILAALAEGEWARGDRLSPTGAVQLLGLTAADGFKQPQPKPGEDALNLMRDEYKRWAANEGAKYQIKKLVPKTK